jgi:hypothetical protein
LLAERMIDHLEQSVALRRMTWLIALSVGSVACTGALDEDTPLDLDTCPSPETVRPFQAAVAMPDSFALGAGTLYYIDNYPPDAVSRIAAFSFVDGQTRVLGPGWGNGLWLEGERLLFGHQDQLMSVPLIGGDATIVLDGLTLDPARTTSGNFIVGQQLDSMHFYWLQSLSIPGALQLQWSVWRIPRTGGAAEMFVPKLPINGWPNMIRMTPTSLVIATLDDPAQLVSKTTGEVRTIKPEAGPIHGLADDAVLTQRATGELRGDHFVSEFVRSPLDGSPASRFWIDKPPTLDPGRGWSDGRGGWVFATSEKAIDGLAHATIWQVDAAGVGKRIACDREALPSRLIAFWAVIPAPDGIYGVMGAPLRGWSVVRMAYPSK